MENGCLNGWPSPFGAAWMVRPLGSDPTGGLSGAPGTLHRLASPLLSLLRTLRAKPVLPAE